VGLVCQPHHHYDARLARTCQPNSTRRVGNSVDGYIEPNSIVLNYLVGIHKAASCKYLADEDHIQQCDNSACATDNVNDTNVVQKQPNMCTASWVRYVTGYGVYNSGGDPTICSA
jgi:hypothetical protein